MNASVYHSLDVIALLAILDTIDPAEFRRHAEEIVSEIPGPAANVRQGLRLLQHGLAIPQRLFCLPERRNIQLGGETMQGRAAAVTDCGDVEQHIQNLPLFGDDLQLFVPEYPFVLPFAEELFRLLAR